MKKIIGVILIAILSLSGIGILAGILVQLFISSQAWTIGKEISYTAISFKPEIILGHMFTKEGLIAWALLTAIIFIAIAFSKLQYASEKTDERGVKYSSDGTFGTAKWMDEKTVNKVFDVTTLSKCNNIMFGEYNKKIISQSGKTFGNKHIIVFGASGSGKSFSFVRNNILQVAKMGQSMVLTDPKGELYQDMVVYLESIGYNVKVFNLVQPTHSDRWNPLSEVSGNNIDLKAQLFSDVVIKNTRSGTKVSGDMFWDRAEQNLLKALAIYIATEYPPDKHNIAELYKLLSSSDSTMVDMIFEKLPLTHPAKAPYNIYKQASDNVRTGVIIGLGTRLQVFQNQTITAMTETNDIDLESPARERCAYFCIMSDTSSALDYLASLYYSFLFTRLINYADQNGGKGEKEVYFMLDEFANIGEIPDFVKKIATMRSRGLHCHIIIQSIAQLKEKYYNEGSEIVISNCDTKLCLGCNDISTARFMSDSIGTATIKDYGTTKQLGLEGVFDYGRQTVREGKRYLLNPEEIMQLPQDIAIVMVKGNNPLLVKKVGWNKHYLYKKTSPCKISDYIPHWVEKNKPSEIGADVFDKISAKSKAIIEPISENKDEAITEIIYAPKGFKNYAKEPNKKAINTIKQNKKVKTNNDSFFM
ncbi:MAG TPA: type IV secretory system conjugative DNA transfer family protein [Clostridiales bacterium]|nr:type IV secretory system conjugative DNA transfer family protein [Clostridiales bacterium]